MRVIRYASARTWGLVLAGALSIAMTFTFLQSGITDPVLAGIANNLPSTVVTAYAAIMTAWCAGMLPKGATDRRSGYLLACGAALYAIGSVVWAWIEVTRGIEVPFPGLPDVFFLLMYVPLTLALWMGLYARARGNDLFRSLTYSGGLVVLVGFALFGAVGRAIAGGSSSPLMALLSYAYPVFDMVLLLWPALAIEIAGVLASGSRDRAPWRVTILGVCVLALTDAVFTVQTWNGTYSSGGWLDVGWIAAFLCIAAGVSLMVDQLAGDRRRASRGQG